MFWRGEERRGRWWGWWTFREERLNDLFIAYDVAFVLFKLALSQYVSMLTLHKVKLSLSNCNIDQAWTLKSFIWNLAFLLVDMVEP